MVFLMVLVFNSLWVCHASNGNYSEKFQCYCRETSVQNTVLLVIGILCNRLHSW